MNSCGTEVRINNQTILEEPNNENYQPTEEEIREYALYIGIDPEQEDDLLWLAREGILQPVPRQWKACQDEQGELYYFNFETGQSSWDHPFDEVIKRRVTQQRAKRGTSDPPSGATRILDSDPQAKEKISRVTSDDLTISDPYQESVHSVSLDHDLGQFRQRIERSTDEEKLQILDEHRLAIETFRDELRLSKEREERTLREQMQNELRAIESDLRESLEREKKSLVDRHQVEWNTFKQLKTDTHLNALQIKYEYDEKSRQVEHRHKKELEHFAHRYEQSKIDREKLEKRLKEKNEICANLRRTIDQLYGEKASLERQVRQHEEETKRKISEDEHLSDSDSDVMEMKETFKALEESQLNSSNTRHPMKSSLSLIDSGHWSNSFSDRTYHSQSSLITREAVLRAARDVLPPGVIDHLSFNRKANTH